MLCLGLKQLFQRAFQRYPIIAPPYAVVPWGSSKKKKIYDKILYRGASVILFEGTGKRMLWLPTNNCAKWQALDRLTKAT